MNRKIVAGMLVALLGGAVVGALRTHHGGAHGAATGALLVLLIMTGAVVVAWARG